MLKVKHFMDAVEPDDGLRIWVEPLDLARDLRQWCRVHAVLPRLGPPRKLWDWFEQHTADGGAAGAYDYFRGIYHDHLADGPFRNVLQGLAARARRSNLTLLHQGEDPAHNTATALYEFVTELQSYCAPEP